MILVDTTVLAYAVGEEHPLRAPCRRLIAAAGNPAFAVATTVEVLQEFAHVRARRRQRADAVSLALSFAEALTLLETSTADLEPGLQLFLQHEQLGAFDAVLAALAMRLQVEALVSADRAFTAVPGLTHVDPSTSALDRLLPR